MDGYGVKRHLLSNGASWMAIGLVIGMAVVPLLLALSRLAAVTDLTPMEAVMAFPSQPGAMEVLRYLCVMHAARRDRARRYPSVM